MTASSCRGNAGVVPRGSKPDRRSGRLTDNFGMAVGNHRLTFGTHGELIDLVDDALASPAGSWAFDDLDSLDAARRRSTPGHRHRRLPGGVPRQADRRLPAGSMDADATAYVDRRTPPRRAVPAPCPPARIQLALRELGINTALTPSGNALWSPRLGVNYDLSGRGTIVLRGGLGLFAGRPAYQWFRNVYARTGAVRSRIEWRARTCRPSRSIRRNQPTACAGRPIQSVASTTSIRSSGFHRTSSWLLGADFLLPGESSARWISCTPAA